MKKFFKKKYIIPIILVLVIVFMAVTCGRQGGTLYEDENVQVRDIVTYHNFSGNVEVVNSKKVVSQASQQVVELLVEEGDNVKEGDVIAILDSDVLQQNIDLSEVSLSTTELSNYYNVRDAQKSYNDFKSSLDAGLNPQINAAQASKDGAYTQALMAQRAYDEAKASFESSAEYISAKTAFDAAKAQYEALLAQYEAADETAKVSLEVTLNEAKAAYDGAAAGMSAAESAGELSLRTLSDAVLTAITAYDTACKSYDATVEQVNQTLETYKNAV
ncbi:MAG: HlyD family secretion protein, partial [Alistipes sp.]|nr:HlyD family secretion protein [Alistipes sp.]